MFNYSEILKACRARSGFTQKELATLSGISFNSIGNWENERCIPNVVDFERILNVYGLTLEIGLKNNNKRRSGRW